jgi:hypothetical protein
VRKRSLLHRRPAEAGTAATGTVGTGVVWALTEDWRAAVITFVVAWLPTAWTYVVANGGLAGLWRRLLHGGDAA